MLIPTCWIELNRTVRSYNTRRFAVLGKVRIVTGDGGLQDFAGAADIIHWNEGKGLDSLKLCTPGKSRSGRSFSIGTVRSGRSS